MAWSCVNPRSFELGLPHPSLWLTSFVADAGPSEAEKEYVKSMTSLLVGLIGDKEELTRLKHIFQIIDEDHDGFLSQEEI